MNENGASGFGGGVLQIKIKPVLTEQPCVSECACTSVSKHIHVFGYVHSCVVTCLSPPHLLQPHAPPPYPQGYCPTPDPALPGPSGPVAKKKKKKMWRGTVFCPHGGQSVWICQPSLGPSPLGCGAQQAPSSPQEDGGLWNEPSDSRLQRRAFVW